MVGRHQRADEVERGALDPVQVLLRVVALVEHQRDLLGPGSELPATPRQVDGEALVQRRVGAVAGIGAMQQRQARVGADQQGHADDAQGLAAFLAVAASGQLGALVEGADVGEEVGGIEQQLVQAEAELAAHVADQVAFDGSDRGGGDAVHVVPEALAGELAGADRQQTAPAMESNQRARAALEEGVRQRLRTATSRYRPTEGPEPRLGHGGR